MFCMDCGHLLPKGAAFCDKCNTSLVACKSCKVKLPDTAKFCWSCGSPQGIPSSKEEDTSSEKPALKDPETVLPQRPASASYFANMGGPKNDAASNAPAIPSPFKPLEPKKPAAAPRGAASVSSTARPGAFRPAASDDTDKPAPRATRSASNAPANSSPFKPLEPKKPAAAPRGAASVSSASRPGAFRPAAAAETKAETPAPAPAAAPAFSAFKPLGSTNTDNAAPKVTSGVNAFKALETSQPEASAPSEPVVPVTAVR
ncbi:MAG: zinc ribbon domain-containing protein, partial [Saccharofermentans sp.]|nr:zinc ribbon domain-containing protein [Saccharofermentans sp.]